MTRLLCSWPDCSNPTDLARWLCGFCWRKLTRDQQKNAYAAWEGYEAKVIDRSELDEIRAVILKACRKECADGR